MSRKTGHQEAAVPDAPGTYIIVVRLHTQATLRIGSLGKFHLRAGHYYYVGSAHGPGGLAARINHHMRRARRPHWHIDYLRASAHIETVYYRIGTSQNECHLASRLASIKGVSAPIAKFGSSDCACKSHLFYSTRSVGRFLRVNAVYAIRSG